MVEIFSRFINKHLSIKSFYGTSENEVKTQIWIAVSVYVLVAIVLSWFWISERISASYAITDQNQLAGTRTGMLSR